MDEADNGGADAAGTGPPGEGLGAVDSRIADRYRLIAQVGTDESGPIEFWLARDSVLARQVGVTLVAGSDDPERSAWAASMVTALLRWGQFSHPGCPRILDVVGVGHGPDRRGLPDQVAVAVVTDWAPGPTLVEFLGGGSAGDASAPRPPMEAATALGMVAPLAAAADAAHKQGLLLGCHRPELMHVAQADSRAIHVHLGFPLPDPTTAPGDDVRGLGAALYALLTGRWPLARVAAGVGPVVDELGRTDAPPPAPDLLHPGLPRAVSDLAMNALGVGLSGTGMRTATAFHQAIAALLDDDRYARPGLGYDEPGDRIEPAGTAGGGWLVAGRSPWRGTRLAGWAARMPHTRRAVAAGVIATLGVLGVALWPAHSWWVHSQTSPAAVAPPPGGATGNVGSGAATVVSASVYDPTGQPDNPTQVWRALGTDPKAGWSTDTYLQPFPALKPGVGIMLGFAGPVQLTSLTITSPSVGSELEIRSAPNPTSSLAETTLVASTTLRAGETVVALTDSQPVGHVLVWITKLGGGGDDNVTEISNLRFVRATD